jgi:hypothetical protein
MDFFIKFAIQLLTSGTLVSWYTMSVVLLIVKNPEGMILILIFININDDIYQ